MGLTCSRRQSAEQQQQPPPEEKEENTNDNCCLTELPKEWTGIYTNVLFETPWKQLQGSPLAPSHPVRPTIGKNRERWIKAVLKVRLLSQFRIRWVRAGTWLDHNPFVPELHGNEDALRGIPAERLLFAERRYTVSRLWVVDGNDILKKYAVSHLFGAAFHHHRLAKSHLRESGIKEAGSRSSSSSSSSSSCNSRFRKIGASLRAELDHE